MKKLFEYADERASKQFQYILLHTAKLSSKPNEGLSARSSILLQLMINCLTCPAGDYEAIQEVYQYLEKENKKLDQIQSDEDCEKFIQYCFRSYHQKLLTTKSTFLIGAAFTKSGEKFYKKSEYSIDNGVKYEPFKKMDEETVARRGNSIGEGDFSHSSNYLFSLIGMDLGIMSPDAKISFDPWSYNASHFLVNSSKKTVMKTFFENYDRNEAIAYITDLMNTSEEFLKYLKSSNLVLSDTKSENKLQQKDAIKILGMYGFV